jgi:hypothetical protein
MAGVDGTRAWMWTHPRSCVWMGKEVWRAMDLIGEISRATNIGWVWLEEGLSEHGYRPRAG